jgi:hypothetical protein
MVAPTLCAAIVEPSQARVHDEVLPGDVVDEHPLGVDEDGLASRENGSAAHGDGDGVVLVRQPAAAEGLPGVELRPAGDDGIRSLSMRSSEPTPTGRWWRRRRRRRSADASRASSGACRGLVVAVAEQAHHRDVLLVGVAAAERRAASRG